MLEQIRRNREGVTDRELCEQLGYTDSNKVRPRRNELYGEGLVQRLGERECKVTGHMATVWGVTNEKENEW